MQSPLSLAIPEGVPSSITWKTVTPMNPGPCPRSSHGVSVVGDSLYVFGGESIPRTPIDSKMHILNLASPTGGWEAVSRETAPPPRLAHAQIAVGTKIYIFGGRQSVSMDEAPLNDLYCFDTATRQWSDLRGAGGTPPCPRSFHVMTAAGGKLFVFGGCPAGHDRLADLYAYDIASATWEILATPAHIEGRGGAGFSATPDGKSLLVCGGFAGREMNDVHAYSIATGSWTTRFPATGLSLRPRSVWPVRPLPGTGFVVGFGGEVNPSDRGHDGAGGFANDTVVINAATGDASTVAHLGAEISPRGWTDSAMWAADKLVIFGGLTGSDADPVRLGDVIVGTISGV